MSFKTLAALGCSLAAFAAHAEGFKCASKDGKVSLVATTSYETGASIDGNATLVSGGSSVRIEESQYKNIDGELFYYSVMDEQNARGIPVNRVVRLDAKVDDNGNARGTLSIHRDFGGRIVDPIKVAVNCKVN
ncbi:MAG: hypothetical protein ABIR96_06450 [Bdellovibrionota bacterium]